VVDTSDFNQQWQLGAKINNNWQYLNTIWLCIDNTGIRVLYKGDTKQSLLESTSSEITQNKHVKVLHYFVDDIKWLK
jgi:hypothetical protein